MSAGLDYPGVGPEHSFLGSIGRAEYPPVTDDEVLAAFALLARTEGILAAFSPPTRSRGWRARPGPSPAAPCSSTSPGVATRTSSRRWS